MDIIDTTPQSIATAAQALRQGEVIAYPTETVYGLGCDPFAEEAVHKLYNVKGRPKDMPVILIIGERSHLLPLAKEIPETTQRCIDAFWPGPLSILLTPVDGLPSALIGANGKVCVRWSSSEVASELCREFGGAIVSTSANLTGEPPALSAAQVPENGVGVCIDGGKIESGVPSTIYNPEEKAVVREGAITQKELRDKLS